MFNWGEFIVKNKIKSFLYRIFVKSWEIKYPLLISIISVCFTGAGWHAQHKAADNYEKNTRQVIINSTELANFQLDMLIGKLANAPKNPVTLENLEFQVDSLKQNLSVIRDVQITNLPSNESMNYQTYRQDLSDAVYRINSDIDGLKESYHVKNSDPIPISNEDLNNLLHAMAQLKYVLDQDKNLIKENKNLYDVKYRKFVQEFDKKNSEFIQNLIQDANNHNLNDGYNY